MEIEENIELGIREDYGRETRFAMSHTDRRHHLYVIGQTGSGKTTLLRNLAIQDILAGRGVGIIDPHGDWAAELLHYIPPARIGDVIYFNPADTDHPIAFNLFKQADNPYLVACGIVEAMKSIWGKSSWGPRLEYVLSYTMATLLECENESLLGVQRILSDAKYRAWVVKQVKDPWVRNFWANEFEKFDHGFLQEVVAPIQNKVGKLLLSPKMRNVIGQAKSKINARFIMDNRRIFIANLSKGLLGEETSNLFGALLVSQFKLAAMSRANVPEHERRDFGLMVDEFQSFSSDSFASILSEARKYRLHLTLSHQYIEQVLPEIRNAVFGNVGSLIAFRVGQEDANVLEREFGGEFAAAQFTRLRNHEVHARLLGREPFPGKTLPPMGNRTGHADTIIRLSREKYASRREAVEDKIRRWLF